MHLAVCFQTIQHAGEACSPSSTWVEERARRLRGSRRYSHACVYFPGHRHTTAFPDAREGEEKKRPLVLRFRENGSAEQVSLCGGEESSRPGQPDARPAAHGPGRVRPHKRSSYRHTDRLFLSCTQPEGF